MTEQESGRYGGGGYRRNWVKYLLIYLVVAAVVYLLVWFLFFQDGGYF